MANNNNKKKNNNKLKKQTHVTKKNSKTPSKKTTKNKVTKKISAKTKTIETEIKPKKKTTEVRNKMVLPKKMIPVSAPKVKPRETIKPLITESIIKEEIKQKLEVKPVAPKKIETQKVENNKTETPTKTIDTKKNKKETSKKVEKIKTIEIPKTETKKEKTEPNKIKTNRYQKMYQNNKKNAKKTNINKKRKVADKKGIINDISVDNKNKLTIDQPKKIKYIKLSDYIKLKFKKKPKKTIDPKEAKKLDKLQKTQAYKLSLLVNKEEDKKPLKDYSKSNIIVRTCVTIYRNLHIIFNSIILITFIILLVGLILPKVYSTKTILFISSLIFFLILVAITQNKYISGKLFTIILTTGMIFAITNLQYTYDFISIMNKNEYSYKTYYVVAFDNTINRSINSINNKKVGVIKQNEIKTSRILNTKINNVTYLSYEDEDTLFNDFYNQKFRAVIVNDNQLKYLENNPQNAKKIKILHEFKAVTKK